MTVSPHQFNQRTIFQALMVVALCSSSATTAEQALPGVHPLFSDHMVFPRDIAAPVWGWAKPGSEVTVQMGDKNEKAKADKSGRWQVKIGPFGAGGPHTLTISGSINATINNVLIGDVWLCSGQSNMEWGVASSHDADKEIAAANHPNIRLFQVPKLISLHPEDVVNSKWAACSPDTIKSFSAVGYYFGRTLHQDLNVPIGLINSSWGGTVAEAWTSAKALRTMDDFKGPVHDVERMSKNGQVDFDQEMTKWWKHNDPGSNNGLGFADPALDVGGWKTMAQPGAWENLGLPDFDGIVWLRRDFELTEEQLGKDLMLHLGPIDDRDTTWVNGSKVGEANQWDVQRVYKVPRKLLKTGRNTVTIRILDTGGNGGLYGNPDQLKLVREGKDLLRLDGEWRYQASAVLKDMTTPPQRLDGNPNVPTVLSNGMIACLEPFAIKGAVWYQGESNAGRPGQYRQLLPTMISDWRKRFEVGDFPFYIVQLANFMDTTSDPVQSGWAELREAQLLTAMNTPNCGVAVSIDIGDAKDIHPRNKQDVGRRLALQALHKTYGKNIVYEGPRYKAITIDGDKIRVQFDSIGGGLMVRGDQLTGFAIAGADGKFSHAKALIDGDSIVVSADGIAEPKTVRYGWANNPAATLFNKDGLPASPFRSDAPQK